MSSRFNYIVFLYISAFIFGFLTSCSSSGGAIEYSYLFLEKNTQDAFTEVYKYRYKIDEGEWNDIEIFVRQKSLVYIINVEGYFGHEKNRYAYDSRKTSQNFTSQLRLEPETVNNVQEAIELALGMYIQDFKSKEKTTGESTSGS